MLRRIVAKDFQSLSDVDIDLGQLTVITGRSNSGKSAVIRAVAAAVFNRTGQGFIRRGADKAQVRLQFDDRWLHWEKPAKSGARFAISNPGETPTWMARMGGGVPEDVFALSGIAEID